MGAALIRPFMFQAHPGYRSQIELLRAIAGPTLLPIFPEDRVEHERWRRSGSPLRRVLRRWSGSRPLPSEAAGTRGYVSGSLPPSRYRILDSMERTHIDADDPLSLFAGGTRGQLPGESFRRWALALCERLGRISLSFWSRTQLAGFLANLHADESREALAGGLLSVLPPAIAPRVVCSAVGQAGILRCLTVASGKFWHKGVPEVAVAVDRLAAKGLPIHLSIVGADIPTEWQEWIARRPFISMYRQLARAELDRLFAEHDLLVFPSHHDTFGWALLEAKSFGMPALATDAYNRTEIVTHGVDGLLLADPFDSPFLPVSPVPYAASHLGIAADGNVRVGPLLEDFVEELTATLHRLLEDSSLLTTLGAGALASVQVAGRFGGEARQVFLRSRLCT